MATIVRPPQSSQPPAVWCLTDLEHALWQLDLPGLPEGVIARHKRFAKLGMLWRTMRPLLFGLALLVGLECLGRDWARAGFVAASALLLAALFAWLICAVDLQWTTADYMTYSKLHPVPEHVSTAAGALVRFGISESRIGVEYLKDDPILFVTEGESSERRRHLIIW